MELNRGDYVTGVGIRPGKYLGSETLPVGNAKALFYKVIDVESNLIHYIPHKNKEKIRKIPSPETLGNYLKVMSRPNLIDVGEVEGSRYKYLKQKSDLGPTKSLIEVFHDLKIINHQGKLSTSERKLWQDVERTLVNEVSCVFKIEKDKAKKMIFV